MTRRFVRTILIAATGTLAACGGGGDGGQVTNQDLPDATPADLQGQDLQQPDPGGQDAKDPGQADPGQVDPGQPDPGPADPGQTDPGPVDPGQVDHGPVDPGPVDSGPPDPGQPEIPGGNGTCVDIAVCLNENQCQTQACVQDCLAVGSPQAQNQFAALTQCAVSKCGQFQDQPMQQGYCVYTQCKAENQPCTKTGNLGCKAMLQCAQGCGQNEACILDCLSQGTYEAQTALFNIGACIEAKCPTGDEGCILSNCMQQFLACQSS